MKVSEYFLATTIALIIMGGLVYMFVFGKTHPAAPQPTKSIETLNKELISRINN